MSVPPHVSSMSSRCAAIASTSTWFMSSKLVGGTNCGQSRIALAARDHWQRELGLRARANPPELTVLVIRDDIERAVRSLPNVTNPLRASDEQVLFTRHSLAIQPQAHEAALPKRADEQAVAPVRKGIASIELRAGGSDHRVPVIDRLLHSLTRRRRTAYGIASILDAVGLHRPAVVLALLDEVQFIATACPVLDDPVLSVRVEGGRLRIAVSERPDLGLRSIATGERVVIGNRTVGVDPHRLAEVAIELLSMLPHGRIRALPDRDQQLAVGCEVET